MNKLYVFNPGHEEALLVESKLQYTPSRTVQMMMRELAPLMKALTEEGDYIYVPAPNIKDAYLLNHQGEKYTAVNTLKPLELCMWALEPHLMAQVVAWAKLHNITLTLPDISSSYLAFSHRDSAYKLFKYLLTSPLKDFFSDKLLPFWWYPDVTLDAEEEQKKILDLLPLWSIDSHEHSLIIKRPFTSSGRGVYPLNPPFNEAQVALLYKQGFKYGISIERKLNRQQDYAVLLRVTSSKVELLGYSKFSIDDKKGTSYTGNLIIPQEDIRAELAAALGGSLEEWQLLEQTLCSYFSQHLIGKYIGYIGIDMFSYLDECGQLKLNPTVEINVRCTMGVIAFYLDKLYVAPNSRAIFQLEYFKTQADLERFNQSMTLQHPLVWDEHKKIIQGYYPLNDISSNHFLAFIIVHL